MSKLSTPPKPKYRQLRLSSIAGYEDPPVFLPDRTTQAVLSTKCGLQLAAAPLLPG